MQFFLLLFELDLGGHEIFADEVHSRSVCLRSLHLLSLVEDFLLKFFQIQRIQFPLLFQTDDLLEDIFLNLVPERFGVSLR